MASTAERRRRSNGSAGPPEWVDVKSAAEEAGISVSTLRNWYRKGLIDSRTSTDNGRHKMVRRIEVLERAHATKGSSAASETAEQPRPDDIEAGAPGGAEQPPEQAPDGDHDRGAAYIGELVDVAKALPALARELADARERAGRAEAKLELANRQLADLRDPPPHDGSKAAALEQENLALRRRVEQLEGELQVLVQATGEQDEYDEMSPEEEDQYLSVTQRRKARRKRKRAARKEERAARR